MTELDEKIRDVFPEESIYKTSTGYNMFAGVNVPYILSDVNTIELLIEAEKRYSQSNITEMENAYYKEFFKKEETINNNSEDMKLYLDDPERVINMIKVRHRINC